MNQFNKYALIALLSVTACSASVTAPAPVIPVTTKGADAALIKYDFAEGDITKLCTDAMTSTSKKLDDITTIAVADRTYDNTMLAFETDMAQLTDLTTPLTFMGYVSTNDKLRAEGSSCEDQVGQFFVAVFARRDVYDAIKGAAPRNDSEKRLSFETLLGFEKNGLKLPDAQLAQVKDLKQKLATLQAQYNANLNNDTTSVDFTASELDGVSTDFLTSLNKTPGGLYTVTTKSTDYLEVTQTAKSSDTRRRITLAYNNRAGVNNTKLLEDAIVLREKIATLLGYTTWADYQIDGRMAKDSKTVLDFLNGLKGKLAVRNQQDIAKLLAFKKESDPTATKVDVWDINYLSYQLQKRDFNLDNDKIKEYFPADVVMKGLFEVYSQLLSVHYVQLTNASTWAPEVKLYEIHDNSDDRLIGYFYTDFVPRPGKYGHAASFPLISARMTPDGYTKPVAAIVANLNPPANGKPSLLSHDDVVTVFHEFGHIMHQTLTRAPYASLSGSAVAQDFVEAPSQMLENWVWDADILSSLSGHYLDETKKLPADLLQKMVAARDFNQGYLYTRQLLLALFDMTIHSQNVPVDVTTTYNTMYKDILGIDALEGGHFPATFGHLMGGYDAGYYGYLWSEVYAADMFTRFQAGGLRSPVVGADYRSIILESGNMTDALDLLRKFLGRDPNSDAFYKKLHIGNP